MWRGLSQQFAEEQAMQLARHRAPGARAVVRRSELSGIDWVVRLWLFDPSSPEPREAFARLRATDGAPLGFETSA